MPDKQKMPDQQKIDRFKSFLKGSQILKRNFSNDDLKCDDISEAQCKELRAMKFSNKPEDLFLEVRSLEERFQFEISKYSDYWTQQVEDAKIRNEEFFNKAIENRKKEILFEIEQVKKEIDVNMQRLEAQEKMILSQIDMIYNLNKEKLADKAIREIGFDFLSNN